MSNLFHRDLGFAQVTTCGPFVLTQGVTNGFTITGGPIRIIDLCSYCITSNDATASTVQWESDSAIDEDLVRVFTGTSASLANFLAGGVIYCDFTTQLTPPVITATTGVYLDGPTAATGGGMVVPQGTLQWIVVGGSNTGTWKHHMRWLPLADDVAVTARIS